MVALLKMPAPSYILGMDEFDLPPAIRSLLDARNDLQSYYRDILRKQDSDVSLKFTLDGNLVGDLGEAIAVELFGIKLVDANSTEGIDGYAPDGRRTIQVKATGTGRGPAFRQTRIRADHLLFFDLDFERGKGTVVFNGPEELVLAQLPKTFSGQRSLTNRQIRRADLLVKPEQRLVRRM